MSTINHVYIGSILEKYLANKYCKCQSVAFWLVVCFFCRAFIKLSPLVFGILCILRQEIFSTNLICNRSVDIIFLKVCDYYYYYCYRYRYRYRYRYCYCYCYCYYYYYYYYYQLQLWLLL